MNTDIDTTDTGPRAGARALAVIGVVGLAWLLAGAADWYFRFRWYGWHQRLVYRPPADVTARAAQAGFVTNDVPASRGGDLSRLIGIPSFAAQFEQERPGGPDIRDAYGFRNLPGPEDRAAPLLVLGDSFMATGYPMTNMFSARLAELSGLAVYNQSMVGVGPFLSMARYTESVRFRDVPPRVILWGFVERQIQGDAFQGLVYQLSRREEAATPAAAAAPKRGGVFWWELAPSRLRRNLPDTSVLAQAGRKAWNVLRYYLLGQITPDVLVSEGPEDRPPVLFFREALEALKAPPTARQVEQVIEAIRYARDFFARRDIRLVLVLIPDKEQVYRDWIPPALLGGTDLPPSCLDGIAAGLRASGVDVVNLLDPFREAARAGAMLYWADDTHWNQDGIRLAAEETWKALRSIPEGTPAP